MSRARRAFAATAFLAALAPVLARAQAAPAAQAPARPAINPAQAGPPAPLYRDSAVLAITVRGDLRHLFRDRDSMTAPWREGTLTLTAEGGAQPVTVPVRMKTRGIYRLKNCDIPPIRLRFQEKEVRGTPLDSLGRPKLTSVCHNTDEYEQYLLLEYGIYRMYQLVTPVSLGVRLVRVTYEDSARAMRPIVRYGFLSEDPARFVERMHATIVSDTGIGFRRLARGNIMQVSLFQYLIGNTDWAVPRLHNIGLMRSDSLYAMLYDFDWSGTVDAPYAVPNPILRGLQSVRERRYRGICANSDDVFDQFVALKDRFAAIYRGVPGLSARNVSNTIGYFDDFYREIENRQRFVDRVIAPYCGW